MKIPESRFLGGKKVLAGGIRIFCGVSGHSAADFVKLSGF